MKVRQGFVSNSSSASYIILLDKSREQFLKDMYKEFEYGWYWNAIRDLTNYIEDADKIISDSPITWNKTVTQEHRNHYSLLLTKLKNTVGGTCTPEDIELVLTQFLDIEVSEVNGRTRLSGWSSMHNSMSDMPNVLKDIVVNYTMKEPKAIITVEQIDD